MTEAQGSRGVRVDMAVRDAAGHALGTVRRVYAWGFEVGRGFWSPYQWVFRHDEVTRLGKDFVEVARSPDDLLRLAAGGLPATWLRHTPAAGGPAILAAPGEAQATEEEQARPGSTDAATTIDRREEREYMRTQGQHPPDAPAHP